jgi:hypothetical protein
MLSSIWPNVAVNRTCFEKIDKGVIIVATPLFFFPSFEGAEEMQSRTN